MSGRRDYSHLASGRVLRSAPGMTAFPVRLAIDMFEQAIKGLPTIDDLAVLDPCCGAGYLLTVLGFTFAKDIRVLVGLDVDVLAVELTDKNLSLLLKDGLKLREKELGELLGKYGKASHSEAVESARQLGAERETIAPPKILAHLADATSAASVQKAVGCQAFDVVVCDVPHGNLVEWRGGGDSLSPSAAIDRLLTATEPVVKPHGIWAIATLKRQAFVLPSGFRRVGRLRSGHREVLFVQRQQPHSA